MFAVFGGIFFSRLAPLYVVGAIADDLGAPAALEGTLALGIGLGWGAGMGVAWAASGRWSDRRRVLVGVSMAALADGLSVAVGSWTAFVTLRAVGGMFAASTSPAVTSLTFRAAPIHRRGLATGIVQSSSRIGGSLVAPVVVTAAEVAFGWRTALVTAALVLLSSAAIFAATVRGAREPTGGSADRSAARLSYLPGGRRNIAVAALACASLLAWLTVVSQAGVPLVRDWVGSTTATAGRIVSVFGAGAAVGAVVLPLTSDRFGRRPVLVVAVLFGAASALLLAALPGTGVASTGTAVGVLAAGGLAMGALPLAISLIPAEAVARGDVGRALLVPVLSAEVIGGACIPAAGFAVEPTLGAHVVFALVGALLLLTAVAATFLAATAGPGRLRDRGGRGRGWAGRVRRRHR